MAEIHKPLLDPSEDGLNTPGASNNVSSAIVPTGSRDASQDDKDAEFASPSPTSSRDINLLSHGVPSDSGYMKLGVDVTPRALAGRRKGGKDPSSTIESFDFDHFDSFVNQLEMQKKLPWHETQKNACQWGISALIGIATALVAGAISLSTKHVLELKFSAVYHILGK